MDIQVIAAVIFVILLAVFVFLKRKNIVLQKLIFPFLYLILYRSNFGINFMNKFAKKHKELIKFFGYSCIGLSIIGMIFISINIIMMIYQLFTTPTVEAGVSLVLPFTTVPGIGYLSFIHWIIAIFVLAIIHEFAHGIVAKAHDLPIKSSGFAFFSILLPIIPAAFVEPDEKQLSKKDDVVQYSVFAAGPIINIVFATLIFLLVMPALNGIENSMTDPAGLSFDLLNETYPAAQAGMEAGVITEVNDMQVLDYDSFLDSIYGVRPGETLNITTDKGTYSLITDKSPDNPRKGFIGIMPVKNELKVKEKYSLFSGTLYWVKDMFRWLFLLNFFIGLFNLLPLGIVDGGRILKTLLNRLMTNKKRANKIWGLISFFFLALLLIGLLTTYFGNPLGFFIK